jgi:hypothetical protein
MLEYLVCMSMLLIYNFCHDLLHVYNAHIMGAVVVLSVTRWCAQQLFVFLGGSLQKFHLWQLALSTKAR